MRIKKKSKLLMLVVFVLWVLCWFVLLFVVSREEVSKKPKQDVKAQTQAVKQQDISFARIDIKNVGPDGNDIELLDLSDDKAKVLSPAWMHKNGNGRVITSKKGELSFKVKFKGDGNIEMNLRGPDLRDKKGKRIPVWVEYKSFSVGGKAVLDAPKPVWHDAPVKYSQSIKDGQVLDVKVKWDQKTIGKKKNGTADQSSFLKPAPVQKPKVVNFARIDVKNTGAQGNDIELLEVSDSSAKVESPEWMRKNGNGRVIQSDKGTLSFKVKCRGSGKLRVDLRGVDLRDKKDDRVPLWIDYTKLVLDGKVVFNSPMRVWQYKPFNSSLNVKDGQTVLVQIEWKQGKAVKGEKAAKGEPKAKDAAPKNTIKAAKDIDSKDITYARVDVKNTGADSNDVEVLEISDDKAKVESPAWMRKNGNGRVIKAKKGELSFKVKAKGDGKLQIDLRSHDLRDAQGGKTPVWISYTKFFVDGKTVFDTVRSIWHDKPVKYSADVKDGQVVLVQVKWIPDSVGIGSGMRQGVSADDASDPEARRKKIQSLTAELKKVNEEKANMSKKLESANATNKKLKTKLHGIRSNWWYRVFHRLKLVD